VHSFKIFAQILILTGCSVTAALAQTSAAQAAKEPDHFDVHSVDTSVDPCVDFYQYSCKKWLDSNPIPADQAAWGHGGKLALWNQFVLKDVLEKASSNDPNRSPVEQKIGDYFAACMDTAAIDRKGFDPLKPGLARIDGLKSKTELPALLAHFNRMEVGAFLDFGSQQDLATQPGRSRMPIRAVWACPRRTTTCERMRRVLNCASNTWSTWPKC